MKITNLKCPSCGGKLEPMEGNPKIVVCEYCSSQFMLEEDQTINYHIHQYSNPQATAGPGSGSSSGPAAALTAAGAVFLVIGAVGIFSLMGSGKSDKPTLPAPARPAGAYYDSGSSGEEDRDTSPSSVSPLYESMVSFMFNKSDPSSVTEEELAKVQYISVAPGSESSTVEYSFQDPYGEGGFEVETLTLEPLTWDDSDLQFFTGLKKLDMSHSRNAGTPEGLTQLEGLVCSGLEISRITELLEDPGQLVELSLDRVDSLEGLGVFENLEVLKVEDIVSPDLKQLVSLKNLKSLTVVEEEEYDPFHTSDSQASLTDYSALSVLTGLTALDIESSSIRDLGFLKSLVNLTSLSLSETEAISIEPLGELSGLTSLKLEGNNEVLDYSPLGRLAGLTELSIDKSTSQDDPDLSALTGLEKLDMGGFVSISFLRNMGNLKDLSLHGCNIDEIGVLSGLGGLERLTCYSVWTYAVPLRDVNFINNMPGLKVLDFSGVSQGRGWGGYQRNTEILGDISNVFNHQGLEELYLNNCMFEIDFGRLSENSTLRKLEMREVSLKENFHVQSSGGMTDLWYDDVALDGHTDFLKNYPNLEELYLDGNQLTNIEFAASLPRLTHLGINNNYVTELSPLNQAESLEYLDIRQNPISSTIESDGSIQILK